MITQLDPVVDVVEPEAFAGADHPMRRITHEVAFGEVTWDSALAGEVAELFDGLAPTWSEERATEARLRPLVDALDRGGVSPGRCVELGSGTGLASALLADRFDEMVAIDLSREMLRAAVTPSVPRVQADSSRLPLVDAGIDSLVLMNMLLFPSEVDRVLAPGGTLVWLSSRGDQTPIYLSPDDVASALPGVWTGVASRAGTAIWSVLRRAD